MAIILGVFDLLAYAIPGSLYLTVFAYASHRAGWIDVPSLVGVPSLLLLIAATVVTGLGARKAKREGTKGGLTTAGLVLAVLLIVLYLVAIWAMTVKPT